ncbi:cryptochrome/photolyase family protein [Methylotetracoccus oryzae]|uniref:cryptochrome/photolyase family protein n=1 Tax=Methylotetracoccus oryzae TaxID=1919059 RepID=UPI00111B5669|nr:deoxyribodipyrimidine photo-lyase [Methylotetracoccus oryzae]
MSTSLVWFRRDLRLSDNPALAEAIEVGGTVIPVFVDDSADGLPWPPGSASRWWLHHSLQALDRSLNARGSRLIIRRGPTAIALQQLIAETGATRILWNRLYEPAYIARDQTLKSQLRKEGLDVRSYNSALLFEPWTVATQKQEPYRVFTPFWRSARGIGFPPPKRTPVERLPSVSPTLPSLDVAELGLLPRIAWDAGLKATWTPGEDAATQSLEDFIRQPLASYADDRDRPDCVGTSRLSPHLHFGEIGPRQIVAALHHARGRQSSPPAPRHFETFVREIGWREFAYHLLYHFPATTDAPLDPRFVDFPWADGDQAETLARWQRGQTGIPLIDAGMRELWHTGWMHNRVRMAVASFLTKNLRLPWLAGARWFWDTLVDADLASNTLGWQWSAGCGADAAPYFRVFNPVLQGQRFDGRGAYVRRWVPELARLDDKVLHEPWIADRQRLAAAGIELGRSYPEPIVDLRESRLQALAAYAMMKEKN